MLFKSTEENIKKTLTETLSQGALLIRIWLSIRFVVLRLWLYCYLMATTLI